MNILAKKLNYAEVYQPSKGLDETKIRKYVKYQEERERQEAKR